MNKFKSYQEFQEHLLVTEIIKFLHEGVQMRLVQPLNEGMSDWANKEIDELIAQAKAKGDELLIAEFVPEIKALVKKFADSGQSGGSAPYTAGAITKALEKLFKWEPLTPVMCTDDEWSDGKEWPGDGSFQNRKLSSVFKESKDAKPYYLHAITFKPEGKDYGFSGAVALIEGGDKEISSSQYIKSVPFEPKTFVIEVCEKEFKKLEDGTFIEEAGGGWWESWIKNPKDLDEVWKYYDKKEVKKK